MLVIVVMAVTIVMISMPVGIDAVIIEKTETTVCYAPDAVDAFAVADVTAVVAAAAFVSDVGIVEMVVGMVVGMVVVLLVDPGSNSLCLLKMTSVVYVIYVVLKIYHSLFISRNINYKIP